MNLIRDEKIITDELLASGGVALIVGDRGTGKTHFCERILKTAIEHNIKCAYVDADVSQSIVGGTGIVGLAEIDKPFTTIQDLKSIDNWFIGSITPVGHGIDIIHGIQRMIKRAKKDGYNLILIDTVGEFNYKNAVIFSQNEIEAIFPDYLIAIQEAHEIEFAICPFLKRNALKCVLLQKHVKAFESEDIIKFNLRVGISKLFKGATTHIISMNSVSFLNTWLGNGRELKWQYFKAISNILNAEVFHVEIAFKTLFIFSRAVPTDMMINEIKELLHVNDVVIQTPDIFANLYIGLSDNEKRLLGVGIIENVIFKNKTLIVKSSITTIEPVNEVKFGFFKTTPTGDFIQEI